jgi:hypothetical protein
MGTTNGLICLRELEEHHTNEAKQDPLSQRHIKSERGA